MQENKFDRMIGKLYQASQDWLCVYLLFVKKGKKKVSKNQTSLTDFGDNKHQWRGYSQAILYARQQLTKQMLEAFVSCLFQIKP